MISVKLCEDDSCTGYIDFRNIPVEDAGDYRCTSDGLLSFQAIRSISEDLDRGEVRGWVETRWWYRMARSSNDLPREDRRIPAARPRG